MGREENGREKTRKKKKVVSKVYNCKRKWRGKGGWEMVSSEKRGQEGKMPIEQGGGEFGHHLVNVLSAVWQVGKHQTQFGRQGGGKEERGGGDPTA